MTVLPNSYTEAQRDYIFGETYDGQRLELLHLIEKPNLLKNFERILDDYGLAKRLQAAKAQGHKVRILEIGCGEGLALHDLAALLEEHHLLSAADLNGIDINEHAISIAETFAKTAQPPRPYLNFYVHDATQPFDSSLMLRLEGKTGDFDFIFVLGTLEFLPQAANQLQKFYQLLLPGGLLYFHDLITNKGSQGWLSAHPGIEPFSEILIGSISGINQGVDVATATAGWLHDLGAEKVESFTWKRISGGPTEIGRQEMRVIILLIRNTAPQLIKSGLITQAYYEQVMETIYRELSPHHQGQITTIDTLARKPLVSA
jgi:SAM-dependent methyltransferase